jgi:hypothetical protein
MAPSQRPNAGIVGTPRSYHPAIAGRMVARPTAGRRFPLSILVAHVPRIDARAPFPRRCHAAYSAGLPRRIHADGRGSQCH